MVSIVLNINIKIEYIIQAQEIYIINLKVLYLHLTTWKDY